MGGLGSPPLLWATLIHLLGQERDNEGRTCQRAPERVNAARSTQDQQLK